MTGTPSDGGIIPYKTQEAIYITIGAVTLGVWIGGMLAGLISQWREYKKSKTVKNPENFGI